MPRPLIDPRMRHAIPNHWPSLCDVVEPKIKKSNSGQELPDGTLAGDGVLNKIPCRLGPFVENIATDAEERSVNFTGQVSRRTCKLNGYYPQVMPSMWALIDGLSYKIVGVDSDSEKFSTRLRLELIKPRRAVVG